MRKLLFIALLLAGCADGVPRYDEPKNLIPREKMVELLAELSKLEAHEQITYLTIDKYHNSMRLTGDSLLKAKGYSFVEFDESMGYYGSRQDEMIEIYSDVLDQLNKDLGELEASK
jgi:hypothetical protein